ncbi:MAG: hypothetical protein ACHQ49_11055 [Elusimicrobiota bacterium]
MNPSGPRRFCLLTALLLGALAVSARAADAESGNAPKPSNPLLQFGDDIKQPEDFSRFVEGSRSRKGDVTEPSAAGQRRGGAAGTRYRLFAPRPAPRAEIVLPAVPGTVRAERAATKEFEYTSQTDLQLRGVGAAVGLGLVLIAGGLLAMSFESKPDAAARVSTPQPLLPRIAAPPEPGAAPARPAGSPAEESFIDTRMPASTWRAISLREQRLIESWDASREKASGQASLSEWLDANACSEGVDIPLLKAKLHRNA